MPRLLLLSYHCFFTGGGCPALIFRSYTQRETIAYPHEGRAFVGVRRRKGTSMKKSAPCPGSERLW